MPAARSRSVADRDTPKPRSDAYVGLLGLSLFALIAAMLFAYLNWNAISDKPPKALQVAPKGGPAAPPPAGGAAVPPPGGAPAPGPAGAQPPPGAQPPAPAGGQPPPAPQPKQ